MGFFAPSDLMTTKTALPLLPECSKCRLYKGCHSPKLAVYGKGEKKILLVGEVPGQTDDQQGRFYAGDSGKYLSRVLSEAGINMRLDCWTTAALICHSEKMPTEIQVGNCRPNLIEVIQRLQPEKILLLGKAAVQSLIGYVWKEDVGPFWRWVNWHIPLQMLNAWICPVYNPAFVFQTNFGVSRKQSEIRELLFKDQINKAVSLQGRPWRPLPEYEKKVRRVLDDKEAAAIIRSMTDQAKPVAFDFECDRLKPDHRDASILCCAVCDGETSVAFPWYGRVVKAMKEFLESDTPKIGYSLKYEERWIRKVLGTSTRNWLWDGMIAAHVLDSRSDITGLKFQSFVTLGTASYDDHLKPFMKSQSGNSQNKLKSHVSLDTLLHYNAMDSLLEWEVAQRQMKEMKLAE